MYEEARHIRLEPDTNILDILEQVFGSVKPATKTEDLRAISKAAREDKARQESLWGG